MGERLSMKVPLIDEAGKDKGFLYLDWQKRPRHIPRIGEKVVLVGGHGLEGVVADVIHSNFFNGLQINFEPVDFKWKAEIESLDRGWEYRE